MRVLFIVDEYKGLLRTFYLYVKFQKRFWPEIQKAEKLDKQGNTVYRKFAEIYKKEELYNKTYKERTNDSFR